MKRDLLWLQKYNLAKAYFEKYGNLEIPQKFKTSNGYEYDENGSALYYWLLDQKKFFDEGMLSKERENLLNEIGIKWNLKSKQKRWLDNYALVKKYYEYHGNSDIPYQFITCNGYEYDENGVKIGYWIYNQRRFRNSLSDEKRKLLDDVEFRFDVAQNDANWMKNYTLVKNYYEHYGNFSIPSKFRTNDGVSYDNEGIDLCSWLRNQISIFRIGTLSEERKALLEELGIVEYMKSRERKWDEMYELAKNFYKKYKNLEVKPEFKTNDGVTYDEDGKRLGDWIRNQRKFYIEGRLRKDREKLLRKIKMRFTSNKHELNWDKMYELLKKYIEFYGTTKIPKKSISGDDIGCKGTMINLGQWIGLQRGKYLDGKLSKERIDKLEQIGVKLKPVSNEEQWLIIYNLAKIYYEHYGNLEIKRSFITSNGIDKDEKGIKLGVWINVQRSGYKANKLSIDKINKLNAIGMIWNTFKNVDDLVNLCLENGIDYDLNKDILKHISYQEMYVKISFLKDLGIDIVNSGKLHEIFSMSNMNMKTLYGVTLEDLINKYYDIDKGKILKKENS